MENQIRENLRNCMYDRKVSKFKDDVISLINNGEYNMNIFPNVADNIYKKAYADKQRYGLTAVLNESLSLIKFFNETMNVVLKQSA